MVEGAVVGRVASLLLVACAEFHPNWRSQEIPRGRRPRPLTRCASVVRRNLGIHFPGRLFADRGNRPWPSSRCRKLLPFRLGADMLLEAGRHRPRGLGDSGDRAQLALDLVQHSERPCFG